MQMEVIVMVLCVLTEPAQDGHIHQALLRRDTAVPREQVSQHQHVQLRLVVSKQHGGSQLFPLLALQQAIRILNFKPHAGEEQHGPLERARSCPLSESTIANNVQYRGCDCAIGCADDEGGEGSGAAGVEVDVLVFDEASEDVKSLGDQEDGDGSAEEDVGEDGGEGHDVGVGVCRRTRALGVGGIPVWPVE
jgi:hypothetical protein